MILLPPDFPTGTGRVDVISQSFLAGMLSKRDIDKLERLFSVEF